MKKSTVKRFLTVILGMFILAGCTSEPQDASESDNFVFEITNEQTIFSMEDNEQLMCWHRLENGNIYAVIGQMSLVNDNEKTLRLVNIPTDSEAYSKQIYSSPNTRIAPLGISVNESGNITIVTADSVFSPSPVLDFYEYSPDLEPIGEAHYEGDITAEMGNIRQCKVFDGIYFIICENGLYAFDSNFTPRGFVEMGPPAEKTGFFVINGIEKGSDDEIYAYCSIKDNRKLVGSVYKALIKIDPETLKAGNEIQYDEDYAHIFYTGDDNYLFYSSNNDNFYGIKSNGKFEKLFSLTDSAVDMNMLYSSIRDGETNYKLTGNGTSLDLIEFVKSDPAADTRTILTLTAVGSLRTEWQTTVREFNSTNEQYKIAVDVISYGDEAIDAFDLAVISGTVGDIIVPPDDNNTYISKGLYADLGAFLDSDSNLSREDFFPSVLSAMENENREIFELWTAFGIKTSAAPAQLYSGNNGLSYAEIIRLTEENPDKLVHSSMTDSLNTLRWLLRCNFDYFVDTETGNCNFNSDEMKKALEFAANAPSSAPHDVNGDSLTRFIKSKGLLYDTTMFGILDYTTLRDGTFGGYFDVNIVGMPTPNGGVINNLTGNGFKIAVNADSGQKAGAWEFVKTLPMRNSDIYSSAGRISGFAAVEKVFDREAEIVCTENERLKKEYGEDFSYMNHFFEGMTFKIGLADRDDFDTIKRIIYDSEAVTEFDPYVMDIITEEASAYFGGAKSVDEVMEIIQSRVSIYCSERV